MRVPRSSRVIARSKPSTAPINDVNIRAIDNERALTASDNAATRRAHALRTT